ncbi:MAG: hypothetical protein ACRC5M_01955, partial [Anaeroplasmataceae bacterium]
YFIDVKISFETDYDFNSNRNIGVYTVNISSNDILDNYEVATFETSLLIQREKLVVYVKDSILEFGEDLKQYSYEIQNGLLPEDSAEIDDILGFITHYNVNNAETRKVGSYLVNVITNSLNYEIVANKAYIHVIKTEVIVKPDNLSITEGVAFDDLNLTYSTHGLKFDETLESIGIEVDFETNYDVNSNLNSFYIRLKLSSISNQNYEFVIEEGIILINLVKIHFSFGRGEVASGSSTITVRKNDIIPNSSVPQILRHGHELIGWFMDEELTKPFDLKKDTVANNLTLHARWERVKNSLYGQIRTFNRLQLDSMEVMLLQNNTIAEILDVDDDNYFFINNIDKGYYNILVAYTINGRHIERLFAVNYKNDQETIYLDVDNNLLSTNINIKTKTNDYIVDGLQNALNEKEIINSQNGGSTKVVLNVKQTETDTSSELANLIAKSKRDLFDMVYMDLDVDVSYSDGISEPYKTIHSTNLIKITVKFSTTKFTNFAIYRENDVISQIEVEPNEFGEYYVLNEELNEVDIYVKTLGTFAFVNSTQRELINTNWMVYVIIAGIIVLAFTTVTIVYVSKKPKEAV